LHVPEGFTGWDYFPESFLTMPTFFTLFFLFLSIMVLDCGVKVYGMIGMAYKQAAISNEKQISFPEFATIS
jgi:hypothetical protein